MTDNLARHRVVVTGMGAVTPVGLSVRDGWKALSAGQSGIGPVTLFDASPYVTRLAGEVKGFDPQQYMDRKEARRMDRFAQFAMAASVQAVAESGLDLAKEDLSRIGVLIGSGIGGFQSMQDQHTILIQKGPGRVSPFIIPMLIINMASGLVSMRFGFKGPNSAVVTACASGAHAIGDAARIIQRGDADVMITGGAEAAVTTFGYAGFCNMGAMTARNDEGPGASCPFDKRRDGFVMGEGAGIVVLESAEHARKRGARIAGEVAGYGMSGDAHHMTAPDPKGEGAMYAIRAALKDSGFAPGDIDYINAHGTSTQLNDSTETLAIRTVFGPAAEKVPISSTKSMTGHMLGASGAVEFIVCLLAIGEGFVPPTINYKEKDETCDLDYVPNKGVKKDIKTAMSNSFGFGGHNAVLVVKKWLNTDAN